jgi:hypothetical protein
MCGLVRPNCNGEGESKPLLDPRTARLGQRDEGDTSPGRYGDRQRTRCVAPPGSSACEEWAVRGEHMQSRSPVAPPVSRHPVMSRVLPPYSAGENYTQTLAKAAKRGLWENA